MYKKVDSGMDFQPREQEVLAFWKENKIFEKSVALRQGAPKYTFFDGPPTANGKPHIGHILTRCIKDIIPRYRTMKGYDVLRKAGWDTHGLPVELEVEKTLGLDGKEQIEQYGVEPFIRECKKSVWKYKGEWERMSDRVGFWADMDDPYVTYENNYIESEWWALKTIHEKGLLYKGFKIVPYCPRCGTALSSHEVAQGYKDVKETSCIAIFALADEPDVAVLAWTTTPWTLPSNVGLVVNANVNYVRAKTADGKVYILAEALVGSVLGEDVEILSTCKGADLVGKKYLPLFDLDLDFGGKEPYRIVSDDYVTTEDGTGIVHMARAFGEDDNRVGEAWDLPFIQLVDTRGRMCGGTPFDGLFIKDADKPVLEALKASGKLFAALPFEHSYPFCWRCDTPLIYYARSSWFIKMTAVRDKLVANNRSINWIPETIKEGRMGNFVGNVIDWGISRERYWGTPLPVWTCKCGHVHVIGSIAELKSMSTDCPEDIELHKPYIDNVTVICPECGKPMKREPVVLDCWFDSGSMPFAQWHYPFENKEKFESRYPANFISEAIDQTRGWFYTLLAISTVLFDDRPAFQNCLVLGHVQDKDGRKMSKHLGNVVDPWSILDKQGADAVRWYFYTGSMPWLPSRFSGEAVSEAQRKFMGTYWNTYAFYVLYADIDGFDPTRHSLIRENLSEMDLFILSRLNTLIGEVDDDLANLRITEGGRALQVFVDELSNWYVRRCRDRYWGSEMTADKEAAYMTLYTVLKTLSLVSAPFVPFMAESIYQNIVRTVDKDAPESVHLCDFPVQDASFINKDLEDSMERVLDIVTLGRSARTSASIKIRQPLPCLYVQGDPLGEGFASIAAEELNVKRVECISDVSSLLSYKVKPQMRTLGPRYGKLLGAIGQHLAGEGVGDAVYAATRNGGTYKTVINGTEVELAESDILVSTQQKAGLVSATDKGLTVVLDTNLTEALIEEGYVREMVSKIQTMRKEAGFEVADHITLAISGSEKINAIVSANAASICSDVLGNALVDAIDGGYQKDWDINGEPVTITVARV